MNFCAPNLVANVETIDEFTNPKTNRKSTSFRIVFESLERTLAADEVNEIIDAVKSYLQDRYEAEIR